MKVSGIWYKDLPNKEADTVIRAGCTRVELTTTGSILTKLAVPDYYVLIRLLVEPVYGLPCSCAPFRPLLEATPRKFPFPPD
jgi:hypothetical protein